MSGVGRAAEGEGRDTCARRGGPRRRSRGEAGLVMEGAGLRPAHPARPASGPAPASDPDFAAGLGAVSALRAAPSPQPAGSTGEFGPCPAFPLLHPLPVSPALPSSPRPGRLPGPAPEGPAPSGCPPIAFTPARPLFRPDPILPVLVPSTVPVPSALRPYGPRLLPTPHPRPLQLLDRWWQPLLDPLRACQSLGPRALPAGFPLHTDILGYGSGGAGAASSSPLALAVTLSFSRLLLLHLELKRCLFTVEPSGNKGDRGARGWQGRAQRDTLSPSLPPPEPSPGQRRHVLRSFYALVTAAHFPPGQWRAPCPLCTGWGN